MGLEVGTVGTLAARLIVAGYFVHRAGRRVARQNPFVLFAVVNRLAIDLML